MQMYNQRKFETSSHILLIAELPNPKSTILGKIQTTVALFVGLYPYVL